MLCLMMNWRTKEPVYRLLWHQQSSSSGLSTRRFNSWRQRHNDAIFPDDVFKCIFLYENVWILLTISLKFVPAVRINNYLNQCWLINCHIFASLRLNELSLHCMATWWYIYLSWHSSTLILYASLIFNKKHRNIPRLYQDQGYIRSWHFRQDINIAIFHEPFENGTTWMLTIVYISCSLNRLDVTRFCTFTRNTVKIPKLTALGWFILFCCEKWQTMKDALHLLTVIYRSTIT